MHELKRSFAVAILSLGFFVTLTVAGEIFVASRYSDRYHKPACKVAMKIQTSEKLTFNSAEEAVSAGYEPCKKCFPGQVPSNIQKKG